MNMNKSCKADKKDTNVVNLDILIWMLLPSICCLATIGIISAHFRFSVNLSAMVAFVICGPCYLLWEWRDRYWYNGETGQSGIKIVMLLVYGIAGACAIAGSQISWLEGGTWLASVGNGIACGLGGLVVSFIIGAFWAISNG